MDHPEQVGAKQTRLWCAAARDAPVVAVFARCYDQKRSTCVFRWNWKAGTIEAGAWTTMSIAAHRCCLSPDGEFLCYHATGPTDGPFNGYFGGAFAISRLPWLSALTDTQTFGPAGGWSSRDALTDVEQKRLWAIFEDWPMYIGDEHWPLHLGHGWTSVSPDDAVLSGIERHRKIRHAATAPLLGTGLTIAAIVMSRRNSYGGKTWSLWHDDLRFFVVGPAGSDKASSELADVRWASPALGGRVLVATSDARLRVLRFRYKDRLSGPPAIENEHDLSALVPQPGPAPTWAKAGLSG